jgi:hypothetical protein
MPIRSKKDKKGCYYQYGKTGAKYYYIKDNERSKTIAKNKALKQEQAIKISEEKLLPK